LVADADFENEQAAIDTAIALNESGRRLRNTWLERGGRGGDRALALHRELRDPGIRYPHEVVECQLGGQRVGAGVEYDLVILLEKRST
jgi:hypothetical protein